METQSTAGDQFAVACEGMLPGYFIRAFHRFQERVRDPKHRLWLARLFGGAPIEFADTPADAELRRDGVTMMPGYLSPEQATTLRNLLSGFECEDPWRKECGRFSLEAAPAGTHVANIPAAPALKILHDIAFDPKLIRLASQYFGCRPYVDSIQAWWSLSGNEQAEEAENFHRDNDSLRFLKFFLYLTDVGEENGPHKFVRGSHVDALVLDRRRLTDAEVEGAFGVDRVLTMRGVAGDAFMEDTFGVHKGQLPEEGRRLLVQVRYSVTPSVFRSRTIVRGVQPIERRLGISLLHE